MRRLLTLLIALLCLCVISPSIRAQTEPRLEPGDPPRAELISVSPPDASGIVTVTGAAGAVFPTAYVTVRNLYTQETVFRQAGITGNFAVSLFGPGNTPFLILPATDAPSPENRSLGSLPGGPGTIVYGSPADLADPNAPEDAVPFTIAGRIEGGIWSAQGWANTLTLAAGDDFTLALDVQTESDTLSVQLVLQPIADENNAVTTRYSNNGWSNTLTQSGLAVDNLTREIFLGSAEIERIEDDENVSPQIMFETSLPDDLPDGLYVPTLIVSGDSVPARLPLVLNVGGVENVLLPLALLIDHPSDGSRGILPQNADAALSNRVRFNSPTYILPPGTYPVEPYLPNLLANRADLTLPPLLPFEFPGGTLDVHIIRPDNTRNDFNNVSIEQSQFSTSAEDETIAFGRQSPLDMARLTSSQPQLSAYMFDQYGEYQIQLNASLSDIWGNTYQGGGEYHVLIAEPLDLTPGVLPGTPFEVGDALNIGLHLAPGLPADVTVRVRVYPLDGEMIEQTYEGRATRYGYFQAQNDTFTFDTPGEYLIDYEARYETPDGRQWAASLRSAGVIGTSDSPLIAHGARGLSGFDDASPRPAWYALDTYANALDQPLDNVRLNTPYYSSDVAWLGDGLDSGMQPILRIQDVAGSYEESLITALEGTISSSLERAIRRDELPVTTSDDSLSYTYFSAVRPDVTLRQMVIGGDEGGLMLDWDSDDPYNQQIGAGFAGDQPGDYAFLFGGAVLRPSNTIAIYAALAVVTDDANDSRVFSPGRGADGGGDGGALMVVRDQDVNMFFHPTGTRPGDSLVIGDTFSIAGQVAPTLPADVAVTITSPSGDVRAFSGTASAIGYFYDPAQDFAVDEIGVWTVDVGVRYTGLTSAGQIEPPAIEGGILGSLDGGRFLVYVQPKNGTSLPWNAQLTDVAIPAALPYNFNFTAPEGWNDVRAYRTLTTPSAIVEDGELRLGGRSFSYQYNPTNLWLIFPNIEVEGRVPGAAASDVITLTFAFTGTDAEGEPQIISRVFTILHDRLVSLE